MPELQEELEVRRLTNLVEAFGWTQKGVERSDKEVSVTFVKAMLEAVPEEAVGAD